jgi:MFS family permease
MSFRFTGQLNMRFGPEATLLPAMGFVILSLLLFARTPVDASYVVDIMPPMIALGLGAGLAFPSLMTLAMSGATPSDSGLASGLVNTSVQVGGAIGLAVLATLATERTETALADGESVASALNSGYHVAYLVGAGLVVVAVAVAVSTLRSPAPEAAAMPEPAPAEPLEVPPSGVTAQPLSASATAALKRGCLETGLGITIGCGGCPPGATKESRQAA